MATPMPSSKERAGASLPTGKPLRSLSRSSSVDQAFQRKAKEALNCRKACTTSSSSSPTLKKGKEKTIAPLATERRLTRVRSLGPPSPLPPPQPLKTPNKPIGSKETPTLRTCASLPRNGIASPRPNSSKGRKVERDDKPQPSPGHRRIPSAGRKRSKSQTEIHIEPGKASPPPPPPKKEEELVVDDMEPDQCLVDSKQMLDYMMVLPDPIKTPQENDHDHNQTSLVSEPEHEVLEFAHCNEKTFESQDPGAPEEPQHEELEEVVVVEDEEKVETAKKEKVEYNDVIEETTRRLVEKKKSKVLAMAGAFEAVISLHESINATRRTK